jgi:hypothetical protein
MRAVVVKNRKFEITVEWCGYYWLPFHLEMIGQVCSRRFDSYQLRRSGSVQSDPAKVLNRIACCAASRILVHHWAILGYVKPTALTITIGWHSWALAKT